LAGFVFLGFDSSVHQTGRESPDSARVALFACHVNAMFQMIGLLKLSKWGRASMKLLP
jgi:hypothetical protein